MKRQTAAQFPRTRMRRNRQTEWSRRLMRETTLSVDDLIWPIFVTSGTNVVEPVASMPGVMRYSVDRIHEPAKEALSLGIPMIEVFPHTPAELRDVNGSEALNRDNLVCRALHEIKSAYPDLGLMCDVALDPYTSHGHDGLLEDNVILNDETLEVLAAQSVLQAKAGADVIAPSDMMDGRIGHIRDALDTNGLDHILLMAYSAKYASGYYAPFREAVGSDNTLKGDKRTYQMDPGNTDEALAEVALDLAEGADMVMVKPGMPYLDIVARVKAEFGAPTFVYQVSGEYSMILAAAQNDWIDGERAMMESLMAFKRAGANGILTYFAPRAARLLG